VSQDETTGAVSNSGPKVVLVSKTSATNGNITTNKTVTYGITRNHSDIVKFGRHDSDLNNRIIKVLKEVAQRALKRKAGEEFETALEAGSRSRQSREFASPVRVGTGLSDFSTSRPSRSGTGLSL
jgi:hypothetical protein